LSSKIPKMFLFLALFTLVTSHTLAQAYGPEKDKQEALNQAQAEAGNFDVRVMTGEDLDRLIQERSNGRFADREGAADNGRVLVEDQLGSLSAAIPGVRISLSPLQGGVELVAVPGGALTSADPSRDGRTIAIDFF